MTGRRNRRPNRSRRRLLPRPRVVLGILLISLFVGVLVVQAYINAEFTSDHVESEVGDQAGVPAAIRNGGPIINTTGGQESSNRLPERTIALTFDDGPDPNWTPKVLDVLRENDAHGTFFVVGSEVARHPELTRRITTEGSELGLHTFTHPNMQRIAPWRRNFELSQTQVAIAQAANVHTNLVRFPYSSKPQAIDEVNWKIIKDAGKQGYLVVVNDMDSEDWQRPGVAQIVRNATPPDDTSAVILFHDSGGDRSQTLAALKVFIPMMKARGYRFTTVTEGLNVSIAEQERGKAAAVPPLPVNPQASSTDRLRGAGLLWTVRLADGMVWGLAGLFLIVGLLTIGRTTLLLLLATRHARQRRKPGWTWGPPVTEPVSVIVPAYNEKEGIEAAVRSLAGGDYPDIEVVVVDDGSTDGTAAIVEQLRLPNVRVIRVPNGGKANALNTGIALARHDLIVTVDGDTIFEPDSVRMLVQPFASPAVGAVAGNVKVGNRDTLVAGWQHIEYVIGFNLDRRLYEVLNCMPTVPGAIGAFRRSALAEVGGVSDETLAEDTDVTMALCRAGWRVVYEERAKAWTEAPTTLEQLYRQRYRWSYGTMQAMWKHRKALTDSGDSGRFGRVGLPFLALFGVALPLLAPVVDIMLVYGLVFWELSATLKAWGLMLALQMFTAAVAFRFDHESLRPLWRLPLQQFAYRQLMYLVLIQSALTAMTGGRLRWHKLHRAGLTGARNAATEAAMIPQSPVVPSQGVAPAVDTWPPVLDQLQDPAHPAAGRATARPPVPTQSLPRYDPDAAYDPDDLPSAGSPPAGGSGPVFTRGA
ncbi:bifunctional polysaccharide deacetylase/glycosyltransferase family 2 protein [Actinoplanes friuliensis]|jgi:cellulose synthase/poly-beta-1,6-N-acetylglucosamine synthase-like glycosyltransferase/peptidoglycan/xylan/chitin deacetylase (PgdA/CDA1 family)|uniref:Putative bifunctional glycosyltransferase/polysaccharide deacetylase n=1 Tax=Actinoplanes friuliensis DSM 7358 TaxID=1246995 RepID=U5WAQ8_9ACTN|nr:bifunctional polysaccharide deacetylase/glycosyltransferase family 2 protein [Actinoplanes friuliensis]AGZ46224.1 putative bifunctional glycosyltransferase/polysaccharide deacetylase [Actinoplanes friuliensis DSM 7358]